MALEFFLGSFVILLIIGTPIYISMIASSVLYILLSDNVSFIVMIQRMASSVNSFPLLAVPLFILIAKQETFKRTAKKWSFCAAFMRIFSAWQWPQALRVWRICLRSITGTF